MRAWLFAVLSVIAGVTTAASADWEESVEDESLMLRLADSEGDAISDWALAELIELRAGAAKVESQALALSMAAEKLRARSSHAETDPAVLIMMLKTDPAADQEPSRRAERIARLEAAVDGNAYFALRLLQLSEYQSSIATNSLIHRAAQAAKFQSPMKATMQSLYTRVLAVARSEASDIPDVVKAHPETYAFTMAISGVWMSLLPPYSPLTKACKASFDQLRTDCRRILQVIADDADILIDRMIGLSVQKTLADDQHAVAQLGEELRQAKWLSEKMSSLSDDLYPFRKSPPWTQRDQSRLERYIEAWLRDGEVAAMQLALREAGIPLQAPAEWRTNTSNAVAKDQGSR